MLPDEWAIEQASDSVFKTMKNMEDYEKRRKELLNSKDDTLTKKRLYKYAKRYRTKNNVKSKLNNIVRVANKLRSLMIKLLRLKTHKETKKLYAGLNGDLIISSGDKWVCPHCGYEPDTTIEKQKVFKYVAELDHKQKHQGAAGYSVYLCKECTGLFWIMWGD